MSTSTDPRPDTVFGWLINAALVAASIGALLATFKARFLIGHDHQREPCLAGSPRWFLIDTLQDHAMAGDLIAFRADQRMAPEVPPGTLVVKRIKGTSGDSIEIQALSLEIDGNRYPMPYPHRPHLGNRALRPGTQITLPTDHYFVLGDHPRSFDSRYFGPIRKEQWVGIAHVLF